MKRIFSIFIALLILLSQLPALSQTASAAPADPYIVNYVGNNGLSASSDSTVVPGSTGVASQKFVYSGSGWNGAYYTDWSAHDVSAYNTLDFWVKGGAGAVALSVNVGDGTNTYTTNIQTPSDASWKKVSIDFSTMTGVDFTKWNTITFNCNTNTANTTFYINNVEFSFVYNGPQVTVVPWNGAQSAISLAFDDGVDSQLDIAVPALDAKGLKATFFITEPQITGSRVNDWKNLLLAGHEIGNHSKHHYDPNQVTFNDTLGYDETVGAQTEIAQAMGTTPVSYAYPFTNNNPYLVKYLKDTHLSARGGWGNYYMKPSYNPDWMNISSQFAWEGGSFNTDYKGWIDTAISQGAWTVLTVHDVGGATTTLPLDQMNLLINYLDSKRSSMWIAPFGTVSGYWRAQKTIENLTPIATSTGTSYTWNVPSYFPNNINLKVKLKNGDGYQVVQNGQVIQPDAGGNYTISFDAKSLELKRQPYAVKYSNADNLTASTDATVVPGNTGVTSQKFVFSGSGWNGAHYTNDWAAHDVSAYNTLDFWVKGGTGGVALSMYVSDGTNGYSTNIQTPSDGSWQHVSINLANMPGVDFTKWKTITFTSVTNPATFYINNVQFSRT
jgi:peptidoglycan/xylan/chitin deacetylase (PgdA/CDA1 family)